MDTCIVVFLAFLFIGGIVLMALIDDGPGYGGQQTLYDDHWTMTYGTPEEKIDVLQRQLDEKDKEARRKSALAAWLWWNR